MPTVTIDINYPTITEAKEMDFPPQSPSLRSISLPFHAFFSVQFDKYLLVAYCTRFFVFLFVLLCFPEHSTTQRGRMKRPLSFVLLPLLFLWVGGIEIEEGT